MAKYITAFIATIVIALTTWAQPSSPPQIQEPVSKFYLPVIRYDGVVHTSPGKGGTLSYWGGGEEACRDVERLGWQYTQAWWPHAPPCFDPVTSDFIYISSIGTKERLGMALVTNSQHLFNLNEPDIELFEFFTPKDAALFFKQVMETYPGMLYWSPSVSGLNRGWLKEFLDEILILFDGEMPVYGLAFHSYLTTLEDLHFPDGSVIEGVRSRTEYYLGLADQYGIQWVTINEWSVRHCLNPGWAEETVKIHNYLEQHPRVPFNMWFSNRHLPNWPDGLPGCNTYAVEHPDDTLTLQGYVVSKLGDPSYPYPPPIPQVTPTSPPPPP